MNWLIGVFVVVLCVGWLVVAFRSLVTPAIRRRSLKKRHVWTQEAFLSKYFPEVGRPEHVHVLRAAEIVATAIGVEPTQLRPDDEIWRDYCAGGWLVTDDVWESVSQELARFVAETRGVELSSEEIELSNDWITFRDLVTSLNGILRGLRGVRPEIRDSESAASVRLPSDDAQPFG